MTDFLSKIAINKSLLKEYGNGNENNRTVYLNDGDEFQIQLFNPYSYTIGAEVSINGEDLGNTIVIRPGQRIWLERYLESSNKFKFSVYTVDNTYEVKEAIKNNGVVNVRFYAEVKKRSYFRSNIYDDNNIVWTYNGDNSNIKTYNYGNYNVTCKNGVGDSVSAFTSLTAAVTEEPCVCTSSFASTCDTYPSYEVQNSIKCSNTIDTGRVEKGSYSNQKFNTVNIDFASWPFRTENINLLPVSRKQYTDNDLKKVYCHECGRKLKSKFKFCPFCGAKQ
jgi:hypothetical protein